MQQNGLLSALHSDWLRPHGTEIGTKAYATQQIFWGISCDKGRTPNPQGEQPSNLLLLRLSTLACREQQMQYGPALLLLKSNAQGLCVWGVA